MKVRQVLLAAAMAVGIVVSSRAQVIQQPQVLPAITLQVAQIPFGPVLDVIPYVQADGYSIEMSIVPTLTEFLGYDDGSQFQTVVAGLQAQAQPTPLPRFRVRQVVTSAVVWDGQTIVLGGLIAENVTKIKDKVPVLGDIPFLGRLFRSEGSRSEKKNLVGFVTPTIIDPAGNRVHSPDHLPYDPNTFPPQTITVPAADSTTTTTTTTAQ